jgi:hypothetical protein
MFQIKSVVKKMKTLKIFTITGIGLVAALLLVSTVAAMGPVGSNFLGGFGGMMGGRNGGGMMGGRNGGGMMGGYGYGYNSSPYTNQPSTTTPSTKYYLPVYPFQFG